MLRPHWLDEMFSSPERIAELYNHPRFQAAQLVAKTTLAARQQTAAQEPNLIGASPAQAARQAFLEHLQLKVDFESPAGSSLLIGE